MTNLKSFFIGLVIFTTGMAYGQTSSVEIGIEAGPSLISLKGNDAIDNYHKATIGFSAGLLLQYNFKKIISLRTNIAYERKGSIVKSEATNIYGNSLGEMTTNINFDYLTLPILVRATFGESVQYFVNAGPYFGYLTKQTFERKDDTNISTTTDNTFNDKRFDVGISTGLGLAIPIKTKYSVSFEIRNNLGLYNVSEVPVVNNGSIKTNSTNFLLGFAYKL